MRASPGGDVLHVGLNKTATTWLQQTLFPLVSSHIVVGRRVPPDRAVLDAITALPTEDHHEGRLRDAVSARRRDGKPVIVTDEGLTSTLRYPSLAALDRTAERVHAELPDATVLLVVRRQAGLVRSSHRQYVKMGGTASLRRFCAGAGLDGHPTFPERYDLHATYAAYRDRYGSGRVVVLPFEQLRQDPGGFLDALVDRSGIGLAPGGRERALGSPSRNESLSWAGTAALRALNSTVSSRPFHPRPQLPKASPRSTHRFVRRLDRRLGRRSAPLTDRWEQRDARLLTEVEVSFASSNRALAVEAGIDLGRYGYAGVEPLGPGTSAGGPT